MTQDRATPDTPLSAIVLQPELRVPVGQQGGAQHGAADDQLHHGWQGLALALLVQQRLRIKLCGTRSETLNACFQVYLLRCRTVNPDDGVSATNNT